MTASPKVSVLIPAFNVAEALPRAVRSALDQTLGDLEVLVIDDASADETSCVANMLAADDKRVRVLRMAQNGGPGAARTLGLRAAQGTWVAILDADDVFRPGRLDWMVREAESRSLDAIADNLELADPGSNEIVARAFPLDDAETTTLTPERFLANSTPAGRVNIGWMQPIVRREFLTRHHIEWRDLRHAEDLVFAMEVLLAGARFVISGRAGYVYTQRLGTISGVASPHSRTNRSATEQHRALDELVLRAGIAISPMLRRRLDRLRIEISVAARLLDMRDHARAGRWADAVASAAAAASAPRAFLSCLLARYGPSAGRMR